MKIIVFGLLLLIFSFFAFNTVENRIDVKQDKKVTRLENEAEVYSHFSSVVSIETKEILLPSITKKFSETFNEEEIKNLLGFVKEEDKNVDETGD